MIEPFVYGVILAFGLILPLGVQNIFIFNQGMIQKNWLRVVPVVITAAICDTLLILAAVLGVSAIVLTFSWLKVLIVLIGVIFLIYMTLLTWRTPSGSTNAQAINKHWSIGKQVVFAVSVSLLNPHAIIDTIGVIGSASISFASAERIYFTLGTIITSWIWFVCLSLLGRVLRATDREGKLLKRINKISAIFMAASALYLLSTLL